MDWRQRFESLRERAEAMYARQDRFPVLLLATKRVPNSKPLLLKVEGKDTKLHWKDITNVGIIKVEGIDDPLGFWIIKIDSEQQLIPNDLKQLMKDIGAWAVSTATIRPLNALDPLQSWCSLVYLTSIRDTIPDDEDFLSNPFFATLFALSRIQLDDHTTDIAESKVTDTPEPKKKRTQTKSGNKLRSDAEQKMVAVLSKHHRYDSGDPLNFEPIVSNELARKAEVSSSTASDFFADHFKGYKNYVTHCKQETLLTSLKLLNNDFQPYIFNNPSSLSNEEILNGIPAPDEEPNEDD